MNMYRLVCLTLGLLLLAAPWRSKVRAEERTDEGEGTTISLGRVGSPRELSIQIRNLLTSSSRSDLDRLVTVSDCNIALAAGWERVCRTLPEREQDEPIAPDGLAISRFLGLLEGRLQFPIPQAWEASIKAAKGYRQRDIGFPRSKVAERALTTQTPLRRVGSLWLVKEGRELIKLPADKVLGRVNVATVVLSNERAYVALYGWPPSPFRLFAVARGSGEVVWSSKVWAAGDWLSYSGPGWHDVFMCSAGETIAVFGNCGTTVYIEAFDKKTGECHCRFSTAYFDKNSPRE
jgi:hypothetical protein